MLHLLSLVLALSAQKAAAHGGVLSYLVGGTYYGGWAPYDSPVGQTTIQRPWSSYNPIQDVTSYMLACNDDGSSGALQLTATVAAGSKVTGYWNVPWPHNTGPMLTYLANCGGSTCTGVNATTLKWFKIDEAGLISGSIGSGLWAAGEMIANNNSWTSTIPSTVPSGNYLIRFETIALHSQPAQNYPECAQLQITGGGSLAPTAAQLVTFPGGYSQTDPGLDIDIYSQTANSTYTYTIPGPPLYGSSSSGGSSTTTSTKSTTSSSSSSTKTTSSSSSSTKTSTSATSTATGTVPHYGQCGGSGWTGATVCAAPYNCVATNTYYSQCV